MAEGVRDIMKVVIDQQDSSSNSENNSHSTSMEQKSQSSCKPRSPTLADLAPMRLLRNPSTTIKLLNCSIVHLPN